MIASSDGKELGCRKFINDKRTIHMSRHEPMESGCLLLVSRPGVVDFGGKVKVD